MRAFDQHLNNKLKDKNFKEMYKEEKLLLELSVKIVEARKKTGLTQKELSEKAHITQQQLSKIETGMNCNIKTFLKVCTALGIKIDFSSSDLNLAA